MRVPVSLFEDRLLCLCRSFEEAEPSDARTGHQPFARYEISLLRIRLLVG